MLSLGQRKCYKIKINRKLKKNVVVFLEPPAERHQDEGAVPDTGRAREKLARAVLPVRVHAGTAGHLPFTHASILP
jgi:hypothetical protein